MSALVILLVVFFFKKKDKQFYITGHVNGITNGTQVYLVKQRLYDNTILCADTTIVENETFIFQGKKDEYLIATLQLQNFDEQFVITLEKDCSTVYLQKVNPHKIAITTHRVLTKQRSINKKHINTKKISP